MNIPSAWIQLIDSSDILLYEEVDAALKALFEAGEFVEVDGPWWSRDNSRPMRYNVIIKEGGFPAAYLDDLDTISEHLRENEYLLFSEMQRYEYAGLECVSTVIVAKDHVESITSQDTISYLRNRAGAPLIEDADSPDV